MDAHPAAGGRTGLLGGAVVRRTRERRAEAPSPLCQGRSWVARSRPPHLRPLCPHSCLGLAELELPAMPALGLCVFPPTCTPILVVREGPLGMGRLVSPPGLFLLLASTYQLCFP